MREPDFDAFGRKLRQAGVSARYARRAVAELREHHEDLVAEQQARGASAVGALEMAARQLGDLDLIGAELASRRELKCWYYRWPLIGRVALPFACMAALPAAPLVAGVQNAPTVLRWGASLLLAALFTATLFAVLQLSIRPY